MQAERYRQKIAVFLVLTRFNNDRTEILLHRRFNTSMFDGFYDMAVSGHMDKGESILNAIVRESKEEIGIEIDPTNLEALTVSDCYKEEYLCIFFTTKKYIGIPKIMESNKSNDLKWFDIDKLPDNMIPNLYQVLSNIKNNIIYDDGYIKKRSKTIDKKKIL